MDQKAKERVAIAKDALAWVKAGVLIPTSGVFVRPDHMLTVKDEVDHKQLRDVVLGKCKVCARGALFLAKAVRFDNVEAGLFEINAGWYNREVLLEHFDDDQITLIENYFEGIGESTRPDWFWSSDRAKEMTDSQRMVLILKNIIKNKGTFRPEQLP